MTIADAGSSLHPKIHTDTHPASHPLVGQLRIGHRNDRALLAEILDHVGKGDQELALSLRKLAHSTLLQHRGPEVYYRGLLEFSNVCARDCSYCGIRSGNRDVERFTLDLDTLAEAARWCAEQGYGSITLQSGERNDPRFVDFVEQAIVLIKEQTASPLLPAGLGITLCVGEQSAEAYQRFFEAGAHRYLLRIETGNPQLYAAIHPHTDGDLQQRLDHLRLLKTIGYRVGSGVMIGIPGQSPEDLGADLQILFDEGVHMIGMGPYIPHTAGSLGEPPSVDTRVAWGLAMISLARIMMPTINIAATTALQALHPFGRELGLQAGANILMPLVTPLAVRHAYQLYDNKPCIDDERETCNTCLAARVSTTKRSVAYNEYGDFGGTV